MHVYSTFFEWKGKTVSFVLFYFIIIITIIVVITSVIKSKRVFVNSISRDPTTRKRCNTARIHAFSLYTVRTDMLYCSCLVNSGVQLKKKKKKTLVFVREVGLRLAREYNVKSNKKYQDRCTERKQK